MESELLDIRHRLEERLSAAGLDIVHPFDVSKYNEAIQGHPRLSVLPLFGRPTALGFLIANTRALWPRFRSEYRARVGLQEARHPLDRYVTEAITACTSVIIHRHEIRFSHEGGDRLVSMLHAAEASGFAQRGPVHLAIHKTYGPWFGLRAIIAIDLEGPPTPSPSLPCTGCSAPCKDALARAMEGVENKSWRDWLAVRDACPVGRQSRYSEEQLLYHYTKDRVALEGAPSLPGA